MNFDLKAFSYMPYPIDAALLIGLFIWVFSKDLGHDELHGNRRSKGSFVCSLYDQSNSVISF